MNFKLQPCSKPFYAPSGHAQTLLGFLIPSQKLGILGRRIDIELGDGDCLVGRLIEGHSKTVVYLFHGLSGSIFSNYMGRTAILALNLGHSVMLVNHRGCGEGQGLARLPYHSGRAEDLSTVIAKGRELFPCHKHLAIGFSLSGNTLLLLLSGRRGKVLPDYAISVNAPICLEQSALKLQEGFNWLYDKEFVRVCRKEVMRIHGNKFDFPRQMNLYEFDRLYTAPASGFNSREEYYQTCSTFQFIHEIKTPTFLLSAKDDPLVDCHSYDQVKLSSSVFLHLEEIGGHLGYLSGHKTPLGTNRWLDYALSEMIKALHEC